MGKRKERRPSFVWPERDPILHTGHKIIPSKAQMSRRKRDNVAVRPVTNLTAERATLHDNFPVTAQIPVVGPIPIIPSDEDLHWTPYPPTERARVHYISI